MQNLVPEIETETLHSAFAPFGKIHECQVVKDEITGISKQFGIVSFSHENDATTAIEQMNGKWLGKR